MLSAEQRERLWHAYLGNLQLRQCSVLIILILQHCIRSDDRLFRHHRATAREIDSINSVPSIVPQ